MLATVGEVEAKIEIDNTQIMFPISQYLKLDWDNIVDTVQDRSGKLTIIDKIVCVLFIILFRFVYFIYISIYYYFVPFIIVLLVFTKGESGT